MTPFNKILGGLTVCVLFTVFGLYFFIEWELKQFTESLPVPPAALVQENITADAQTQTLSVESVDTGLDRESTPKETSEKSLFQLHEEAYARELEAERKSYELQQELAELLDMPTDPLPTIEEIRAAVEQRETEKEKIHAETLALREGNARSRAFLAWFEGYVAKQRRLLREIKFLLEIPDFTAKKFVEVVPNLEDRLYYIEALKQLHDMDEVSTRVADTPPQFRERALEDLKNIWSLFLGDATVARLVPETNRKAQD